MIYCDTQMLAHASATIPKGKIIGRRYTERPWMGLECVWRGRDGAADDVTISCSSAVAVVRMWVSSGLMPEALASLLSSMGIKCVSVCQGAAVGAPLPRHMA